MAPRVGGQGPLFSSPKGFFGPGVLAGLESRMTGKTPEEAYAKRVPQLAKTAGALGTVLAPGSTFLRRLGGQTAISGAESLLAGESPTTALGRAGIGGALQTALEAPFQGAKLFAGARKAAQAERGLAAGTKAWEQKTADIKAADIGRKAVEKSAYEQQVRGMRGKYAEDIRTGRAQYATQKQQADLAHEAAVAKQESDIATKMRAHAEKSAGSIAEDIKAVVAPLKGTFSSDERGLISMLYGRGRQAVSKEFDTAMKEVAEKARGIKPITIPARDAEALGISIQGRTPAGEDLLGNAVVDAGEVAKAAVGRWTKDPGLYRRVVDALDTAGVGNPEARAMYKAWAGYKDFADKTGMIRFDTDIGKFVFDYNKGLAGLVSPKASAALGRRGLGNVDESAILAGLGGPLKLQPPQKPVLSPYGKPKAPTYPPSPVFKPTALPPKPPSELGELSGFKTRKNPFAGHPFVTGMGAEAATYGLTGAHGYGVPFLLGAAAGEVLPKRLVTQAPLDPRVIEVLKRSPGLLNVLLRATTPAGP